VTTGLEPGISGTLITLLRFCRPTAYCTVLYCIAETYVYVRTATLHVNDSVAWRAADERIVRKQRVFSRVEFSGDSAVILHSIYDILQCLHRHLLHTLCGRNSNKLGARMSRQCEAEKELNVAHFETGLKYENKNKIRDK